MKNLFLTILLFLCISYSFGQEKTMNRTSADFAHVNISLFTTIVAYETLNWLFPDASEKLKLISSVGLSMGVGISKEIYDELSDGYFDINDIFFDLYGTSLGANIIMYYKF